MAENLEIVKKDLEEKTKPPRKYAVILHNDDFTPIDFVVELLATVFSKSIEESGAITLKVHHEGKAAVGQYPKDIAESKIQQAMDFAYSHEFPLMFSTQEV